MKKFLAFIFVIIFIFSMDGCVATSSSDTIVSRWQSEEGFIRGDYGTLDDLEFFEDKTYASDDPNYSGNYSISGDRIKLQGLLASTITYTFKVKGDTLTFYNDKGELIATYKKIL